MKQMPINYIFISDEFYEDYSFGGAEICNHRLIKKLKERGHDVKTIHSFFLSDEIIDFVRSDNCVLIFGNFLKANPKTIESVANSGLKYFIYEHDHKYLCTRDPSVFPKYKAPKEYIINYIFYKNAYKVIGQSQRHCNIIKLNLEINNVEQGYNFWGEEEISNLKNFADSKKNITATVLGHIFVQKNTEGAIKVCQEKSFDYQVIPHGTPHMEFCDKLSKSKYLVFLPQVNETLSRVCIEANCLNVELITNNNISYLDENWSKLRGIYLINFIEKASDKTVKIFES